MSSKQQPAAEPVPAEEPTPVEEITITAEMTEAELSKALAAVTGRPVWVSFRGPIPTEAAPPVNNKEPVAPAKINASTGTIWCGACSNSQPDRYPDCLKCGTPVLRA